MLENTPVGSMSIHLLAATDWMLVEVDGQPLAQGVLPPTATIQYGKSRASPAAIATQDRSRSPGRA